MLETVLHRRIALGKGISGILESDFKQADKRFRGKAYIIAFPEGPFRLEIPGPFGSTTVVMINNGQEVTVYYPREGKAFISRTDSLSIKPHLPFPLPVDTGMLAALLMGTVPDGNNISATKGFLLESGEKQLWTRSDPEGLEFNYFFTKGQAGVLRRVSARGSGFDLEVTTQKTPPHLPAAFTFTTPDATIKGAWEKAVMLGGDETVLQLDIPESVTITDLRDQP
jgi:hypothetical protein